MHHLSSPNSTENLFSLEFGAYTILNYSYNKSYNKSPDKMMAVAAAQKSREMFAIKKSYSIEVSAVSAFLTTYSFQSIVNR